MLSKFNRKVSLSSLFQRYVFSRLSDNIYQKLSVDLFRAINV